MKYFLLPKTVHVLRLYKLWVWLVTIRRTLKTNKKRMKKNKIKKKSGNDCFSSKIMRNNFVLLFSTKKNDKEYKGKLILYEWCIFMGTIKIPCKWCIYINTLFIQSPKTETYLVNFFLYINSDIFVSLYFMVISHTSIHFKIPYQFKNQLNDEKLSFFEAISFNSWFFKWFNYDHHIYLYIV